MTLVQIYKADIYHKYITKMWCTPLYKNNTKINSPSEVRNATTIAGQTTVYLYSEMSQSVCRLGLMDSSEWSRPGATKPGSDSTARLGGGNRKCGSGAATGRRVRGAERDSQWSAFCKHGHMSQRPYQNIAKNRKPSLPKKQKVLHATCTAPGAVPHSSIPLPAPSLGAASQWLSC